DRGTSSTSIGFLGRANYWSSFWNKHMFTSLIFRLIFLVVKFAQQTRKMPDMEIVVLYLNSKSQGTYTNQVQHFTLLSQSFQTPAICPAATWLRSESARSSQHHPSRPAVAVFADRERIPPRILRYAFDLLTQ